jgi:hypothetical protein
MNVDLNFLGWGQERMKFVIWIIQWILINQKRAKKGSRRKKKKVAPI